MIDAPLTAFWNDCERSWLRGFQWSGRPADSRPFCTLPREDLPIRPEIARGTDCGRFARMLSAFLPGIPREAELFKFVAARPDRGDIELRPEPFADDLIQITHDSQEKQRLAIHLRDFANCNDSQAEGNGYPVYICLMDKELQYCFRMARLLR